MNVLIVGGSRGIGAALADHAQAQGHEVLRVGRSTPVSVDLSDESSVAALGAELKARSFAPDVVINTVGVLHTESFGPEKALTQLTAEAAVYNFKVNALGPALLAKALWPWLRKRGPIRFASLSARVGSISDNRLGGWHSYRASKSAQNMMLTNVAIELKRVNPDAIVALLHPGTVDTGLSKPFQAKVPTDKLFTPERAANQLWDVLMDLTPADTGCFKAWDGQDIAF